MKVGDKEVKGIFVKLKGGEYINVSDLPRESYEAFLETMHQLRLAYITIINRERPTPG